MKRRTLRIVASVVLMCFMVFVSDLAGIVMPKRHTRLVKGSEVTTYLERLLAKHPELRKQWDADATRYRALGYTPRPDLAVGVLDEADPTLLQRIAQRIVPEALAQMAIFSDHRHGEMVHSPWDAGDDTRYVGQGSMENFDCEIDPGMWDCVAAGSFTIDVSSENNFRVVATSGTSGWSDALYDWAACSVAACAAALTACWISGPGWGLCSLAWCVGGEVGCAVAGVIHWIRQPPQ
jgi:hypothetical protein